MSDLETVVKESLAKGGLFSVPDDVNASLIDFGFDSLTMAMTVIEIERALKIKIPIDLIMANPPGTIQELVQIIHTVQGSK